MVFSLVFLLVFTSRLTLMSNNIGEAFLMFHLPQCIAMWNPQFHNPQSFLSMQAYSISPGLFHLSLPCDVFCICLFFCLFVDVKNEINWVGRSTSGVFEFCLPARQLQQDGLASGWGACHCQHHYNTHWYFWGFYQHTIIIMITLSTRHWRESKK